MSFLAYDLGLNTVANVNRSRHTALIVTGNAQFTALWLSLAQRAGCTVIRRTPAEKPWEEAADIAVIDLDTPDFDGHACVARLRASTAELDLPLDHRRENRPHGKRCGCGHGGRDERPR